MPMGDRDQPEVGTKHNWGRASAVLTTPEQAPILREQSVKQDLGGAPASEPSVGGSGPATPHPGVLPPRGAQDVLGAAHTCTHADSAQPGQAESSSRGTSHTRGLLPALRATTGVPVITGSEPKGGPSTRRRPSTASRRAQRPVPPPACTQRPSHCEPGPRPPNPGPGPRREGLPCSSPSPSPTLLSGVSLSGGARHLPPPWDTTWGPT